MSKKRKSSEVLEDALKLHASGVDRFTYICACIQEVELEVHPKQKSQAMQRFYRFKPKAIQDGMKQTQPWWPKGDPARVETLRACIDQAVKEND